MHCDHCGKYTERQLFGVPQCFAYDPLRGHDVVLCTPADPDDFQRPDEEDYEDYGDVCTAPRTWGWLSTLTHELDCKLS